MVNTRRSAKQFALGQRGGILTTSIPASASIASNGCELPGSIADEEPEPGNTLVEVRKIRYNSRSDTR